MNNLTLVVVQGFLASRTWLRSHAGSERGATAVEYGLLVGLIAAVIVVVVAVFGSDLSSIFSGTSKTICTNVDTAVVTSCSTTN